MTKLFNTGGYCVRLHITPPLPIPKDHFHIRITATWAGSRWPDYERDLFRMTLSRAALTKFSSIINLALAYGR